MIMLYYFGPLALQHTKTVRHFYALYIGCGVTGNILAYSQLSPWTVTLGASGSIYGMLAYTAMFIPHTQILLWGILPLALWQMAAIAGVIEGYFTLRGMERKYKYGDQGLGMRGRKTFISHESHIAGLLAGVGCFYLFPYLTL